MATTSPTVKAIAFDIGGVIANGIPGAMFERLAERYSSDATQQESVRDAHDLNRDLWGRFKAEPEFTELDYWTTIKQRMPFLREDVPELQSLLYDSIAIDDGVVQLAARLSKTLVQASSTHTIQIGILSNHSAAWYNAIAQKGNLSTVFTDRSTVIISQEERCYKPQPEVFELLHRRLLQAAAAAPERWASIESAAEIVFIDDTPANVDAAIKVGLRAHCWLNTKDRIDELEAHLRSLGVSV